MRAALPRTRFHDDITGSAARRGAALVSLAIALVATLPGAPARAQSAGRSDARPCTEIEADAERLACYDRALRSARPATPAPAASPPAASEREARRRGRDAEAPAAPVAPTPPAPQAAPAAPATAAAPTKESRRDARKSDDKSKDQALETITVVNIRGRPGENVFTTDKGAVWTQIDGRSTMFPSLPFAATLKPGLAESFFLVPNAGRAVRVRRGQ